MKLTVEGTGAWLIAAAIIVSTLLGVHAYDQHEHRANEYRCAELHIENPDLVCPTTTVDR